MRDQSVKKIVITAADCFIGRSLCRSLLARGHAVWGVVRGEGERFLAGARPQRLVRMEMKDYGFLDREIGEGCDIGVLLAWDGSRGRARQERARQAEDYRRSMDCVESLLRLGCRVIVTAGSQAEYGPQSLDRKVRETDECRPNTEYGIWKLKFYRDAAARCRQAGARLIEPRFFSLYGPGDYEGTLVISTLRHMLKGQSCELTECVQSWDFLYIEDAVRALTQLLLSREAQGIYNFGSGQSRRLREYVEIMHRMTGSTSPLLYGTVPYPETGMVHTNPSVERLCGELGWQPEISFEEGIGRVLKWMKGQGDARAGREGV